MAAPSFSVTNYAGTTTPASDIIGLVEPRLTAAGWVFVEEYAFTQNMGSTATVTSGSASLAGVTAASVQNGWAVGGTGIPAGTTILSGGNTATPVMSAPATASGSGIVLTASRVMRVWKNPAALNGSADFHIGFVKDAAGGPRLAVRAFEGWDTTAKTIQNPCIQGSLTLIPNASTYAATVSANGVGTGNASWSPAGTTTPLMVDAVSSLISNYALRNNTNYDVGVLASKSYVVLGIAANGGASTFNAWLLGFYNPGWADSQATYPPLAVVDLQLPNATLSATNGVSRSLRQTNSTPGAFAATAGPESMLLGMIRSTGLGKEPATQTVRGSRVVVGSGGSSFTAGYWGTLYDAMIVASDSSLKIGDTVAVGSTTYTVMVPYVAGTPFLSASPSLPTPAYLFNVTGGS